MGGHLVKTSLLPLVAVATSAAGCFDVSTDRPAPILIDNFDSGDVLPADHYFDQWRCGQNDPPVPGNCHCDYDSSTYHSAPYSMHLAATVTETGERRSNGAQVYTHAYVAEDLSNMREIVFSARYDRGDSPLPADAPLYVELWCSYVNRYMLQSVSNWQSADWQTFALDLSQFRILWSALDGGPGTCLKGVDSIHFSVNAQLDRDHQGGFDLYIDDVYLR
jgi:hypothetical protein